MKKLLVLVAALALAAPAFAGIDGSSHDLASGTTAADGQAAELCVYCHSPHNGTAGIATTLTPLMNRGSGTASSVCFSCHDGSDITVGSNTVTVGANADFGTAGEYGTRATARTDHPVGVTFAVGALYKVAGTVECSSCHNVHNDTFGSFLKQDNVNSTICLTCHNK